MSTMNLEDIPIGDLLAEIDRRTRAALPPVVYFYGVWPGERSGHFRYDKHGNRQRERDGEGIDRGELGLYPWDVWHGKSIGGPQVEGKLWHWHGKNATLLLSWDRSADQRGGCAATFIVQGLITAEYALERAREDFPRVFARIETHLGQPVELAGPVPVG